MQSLLKSAVAGVALLAASVAAQAADINIVVVSHGQASDPFWSVVKNGVATE
ncbi:MAG: LacI family transcriptional regulator, partial [Brucella intermedia]